MRGENVRVTMPRADVLMARVLMGLMLAGDVAAMTVFGVHQGRGWPTLLIMPGSMALVWLSYGASVAFMGRRPGWNATAAGTTAAGMMGVTLVAVGITLTVAHAGLLAYGAGLIGPQDMEVVFRLFAVGLGLNLAFLGNITAKRMNPTRMPVLGNPRAMGWVGVLSGIGVAVAGVTVPMEQVTPVLLTFALTPCVFNIANMLVHKFGRRKAG